MSRDLVTQVSRALADRAGGVPAPRPGLADAARRQARARRRKQGVGAVLGAAVVATAVLAPIALPGREHRVEQLAARPGPLAVPDGVRTEVTPDTLTQGAAPGVAWTADAVLHRIDGRELGLPLGPVGTAGTPDGGAFIADSRTSDARLRRVEADGQARPAQNVSWPVVGERGQLGFLDRDRGFLVTEVPGGTRREVEVPFDVGGAALVGWLGDGTVVANVPGARARAIGTNGTVNRLRGLAQATATDRRSMVASRSTDGSCLQVRRDQALLWSSCDDAGRNSVVAFSPDSHKVLVRRSTSGRGGDYAVVDADTGNVVRLFSAGGPSTERLGQAVFETDDTVLIAVSVGPGESIVRCSLAGACELAVAHADMADGPAGPQPFDPAWVP